MKCYVCKKKIDRAIRCFLEAKNNREKSQFRDVCHSCYNGTMQQQGYKFKNGFWQKIGAGKRNG